MRYSKCLMIPATLWALTACQPQMDMQGVDPNVYYAKHPIENRVEARDQSFTISYKPRRLSLSHQEAESLRSALHELSPSAVEWIKVYVSEYDMENKKMKASIIRELSHMGFDRQTIVFGALPATESAHIRIDVRYAVVVPPDCPDWRTSPVTTYSNTWQGNFKCSQVVNLGLMVADPRDLVHGTGDVAPDVARNVKVVEDYRSGNSANQPTAQENAAYQVSTPTSAFPGAMGAGGQLGFTP